MRKENETCVQRAKFVFDFFNTGDSPTCHELSLAALGKAKQVTPDMVRDFGDFLHIRLERIAVMMELLLAAHSDWAITGRKTGIVMETESWDFQQGLEVLRANGFTDREFTLQV